MCIRDRCCVTASARPRDGIDFFPLSVDFEEKMYSVGRIPGSFNRREGRPGEKGILTSRVIDRPIRPLFPYDFRNDVSVMCTVMAVDHDCSPEIAALIGTDVYKRQTHSRASLLFRLFWQHNRKFLRQ